MLDDVKYYQTIGAIKELTQQINIKMCSPSATSIDDIMEMATGILDIMRTYKETSGL